MNYKTAKGEPITLGHWYEVRHSSAPYLKPAVVLFTGDVCSGFSHGDAWVEDYSFKDRLVKGDVLREVNVGELAALIWEQFKKRQGSKILVSAEHPMIEHGQFGSDSMSSEYGYGTLDNGGIIVLGWFAHLDCVLPVFVENSFSSFVFQSDYEPLLEYARNNYRVGDWCVFGTDKRVRCVCSSDFKVVASDESYQFESFGGFRIVCGTDIVYSEAKGWVEKCKPKLPKDALVKAWDGDPSLYVIGFVQDVSDDGWFVKVSGMRFSYACPLTDGEKQGWINVLRK